MKSLRLSFWDHSWQYDGHTPENHPLGGSHSALVYLTRELAKLGHEVHIYNNCKLPGVFYGVHYHQIKEVQEATRYLYSDAFISLRDPRVFRFWLNAGVRILWAQDAYDQQALLELKCDKLVRQNIDVIFCISRWQAWTFSNYFHWLPEKIYITRNAIWPGYFPKEFSEPQGQKLVYTSTPFRGLELLLRLFPKIKRLVPDAELHVFSSMQVYQQSQEEDTQQFGHIYKLAEQPGVLLHGSVGQKELAKELIKCKVFAYPNIYPETGCIAAMEALAAGCAVVTSRLGALPETVGPGGILIAGIPGTAAYNKSFIENCVRLLADETARQKMAMAGRDWILNH
ncbi:MAG: glycosyltransferase family 4 protein, partial [bacterium]